MVCSNACVQTRLPRESHMEIELLGNKYASLGGQIMLINFVLN